MIPNIIHFIFFVERKEYGGKPFSFIHFLSIYTAFKVHQPERIYFHYQDEPTGEWWEKAKPYLTLNKVEAPTKIFGNELTHIAHKADVVRLEQLMRCGGIYLDIDVISVNSFEPLRENNAVMGIEHKVGLCSAVILSEKDGDFISIWYDQYKQFDGRKWNYHSVILPMKLAQQYPQFIHVEDQYAFFYPMHTDPSHLYLWTDSSKHDDLKHRLMNQHSSKHRLYRHHLIAGGAWQFTKLCQSYCIHLWESLWFKAYLQNITPDSVLFDNSNFSRLIRRVITEAELLTMRSP